MYRRNWVIEQTDNFVAISHLRKKSLLKKKKENTISFLTEQI